MGVCQSKQNSTKDNGKNVQDEYKIVNLVTNNTFIVQRWSKTKEGSPRYLNNLEIQSASQGNQDDVNTQEENSQKQEKKYIMKCFVNLTQQQLSLIREDISVHKKLENLSEFYINKIVDVYQWKESIAVIYDYLPPIENIKEDISKNKRRIISNVVQAFVFLEKQYEVYHGNICPNNVLINKNTFSVKITDFALNRSLYHLNLINPQNLIFRAPEFEADKNNLKLQEIGSEDRLETPTMIDDFKKADTWSMGLVLGYLALVDNQNYGELFLKNIQEKQYRDAQALLLQHGEDYGVFFFRMLEVIPKNRISIAAVNTLLSKFNLKAEIIQITSLKELEYQEYQIKKSEKESINKIHVELQSQLIGKSLGEKILDLFPKLNVDNVTKMHFKIQRNELHNSGLNYFIKLFSQISFNQLDSLELNFGLNGLVGREAGENIKELIENIQAPQLNAFRLYFSMNKLGDEGAVTIFDAMVKMPHPYLSKLELGVGQNDITDKGVEQLGILMNNLDMMKISGVWIYLAKNNLTVKGIDAFLANLYKIEEKIISQSEFSFMQIIF